MKRKISVLMALVLVLSFSLVTAVPVGAHDPVSLGAGNDEEAAASWATDFGYDDLTSAHLVTGPKETDPPWGDGDEARIVIDMEGYTLGDIASISWFEYLVEGYPAHVDITLDTTDEDQSVLTAEMAYNNADGVELDEGLVPTVEQWLQTFELTEGDGFGQVGDTTMLWVAKLGAGNDDAPSGTLADWKLGIVANDPFDELPATEISADTPVLYLEIEVDNWVLETEAFVDNVAINGDVLNMEVDPMASYEMHFEGALTVEDGIYSGMIPMIKAGGFNVYARNGASAWFGDAGVWTEEVISNHDAFLPNPLWDPDTPDWYQYSLRFYEEGGVQKWRVANHSGATAANPWSTGGGSGAVEQGVPISGFMDWDDMYAFETDVGEYLPPIDPLTHPEIPGGAEANGGGAACWDMDWSWGSEAVPLQHPGFKVTITGSGPYSVTLAPAPHGVINVEDDKVIVLNAGWTIISTARTSDIKLVNSEIEYVYSEGFVPPSLDDVNPLAPLFVKTIGGGLASFVIDDSSQGLYSLDLNGGWNLISIPQTNAATYDILSPLRFTATGDVALATLASQGDYNQNTDSFYKGTLSDTDWGTLPVLNALDGYWAYMNAAKDFGIVAVTGNEVNGVPEQ